ncbi:MAG: Cas10/Cmr2 second palm domain-containing protein [Archaeoglobaceae archaeon]
MLTLNPISSEVLKREHVVAGEELEKTLSGKKFKSLKNFNYFVADFLRDNNVCKNSPADTRFPGFFSTLSDHSLSTTAIAVPLALELSRLGVDFGSEYDGKFADMLRKVEDLKEIVRCASLLHDIGKHPPWQHDERTRKYVERILRMAGFEEIAKEIATCSSKHHYRWGKVEEYKPETKLEWVIAVADKISVADRIISLDERMVEVCKWIQQKLGNWLEEDDKKKINSIIEYLEKGEIEEELEYLVPSNPRKVDNKLFNLEEVFGVEPELGVLCLEVGGIQKFINASDFRKYVSGASILLENVLEKVREMIEDEISPESLIYAKGGSLLAIIPPSYYDEIREKILKLFKEKTVVAKPKLPPRIGYKLYELKYGPKVFLEDQSEVSIRRRNFGEVVSRTLNFLETYESPGESLTISVGEICKYCYEFKAENYSAENERICRRCYLVVEEHKRTKEQLLFTFDLEKLEIAELDKISSKLIRRIVRRFEEKAKNKKVIAELRFKKLKRVKFHGVSTWNYLGRQHFFGRDEGTYDIAFIKGDGDNFGKVKESANSITLFRRISNILDEVIEGSIVESFSEILIKMLEIAKLYEVQSEELDLEIPFDVVFIGGDDFLVLMDPAFVFVFVKSFRRNVQKLLGSRRDTFEKETHEALSVFPLGVSMGVAIVKNRIPIKATIEVLNEMVRRAKLKSKEDKRSFGGEVYVYMQKFDQIPTRDELETQEKYTSFPMNGEEFLRFIGDLSFFVEKGVSPNWLERVFGNKMPESTADACIELLFKMARTKKDESSYEVLKKLYEMHGKFQSPDTKYFHVDLSDSLRILTENVKEKLVKETARVLLGD